MNTMTLEEQAQEALGGNGYNSPILKAWEGNEKKRAWLPLNADINCPPPCVRCPQAVWHRANVSEVRGSGANTTSSNINVTRCHCKLMHMISYSSTAPNELATEDWVMDCDGPLLEDDSAAN